jgi:hypothetical protein
MKNTYMIVKQYENYIILLPKLDFTTICSRLENTIITV